MVVKMLQLDGSMKKTTQGNTESTAGRMKTLSEAELDAIDAVTQCLTRICDILTSNLPTSAVDDIKSLEAETSELLVSLTDAIPHLNDDHHKNHLKRLLQLPWQRCGCITDKSGTRLVKYPINEEIIEKLAAVYVDIATANVAYVSPVLQEIVARLIKPASPSVANVPNESAAIQHEFENELKRFSELGEQTVFKTLTNFLRLVPTASKHLPRILDSKFPFYKRAPIEITSYIRNLLRVATEHPSLRPDILETIIKNLVVIDTVSPRGAIEEVEQEVEDKLAASLAVNSSGDDADEQFQMDTDHDSAGTSSTATIKVGENVSAVGPELPVVTHHRSGHVLDLGMKMIFQFVVETVYESPLSSDQQEIQRLLLDKAASVYGDLLEVFEKVVLHVHATCHVQFVIFHTCSIHPSLATNFVNQLWTSIQDPSVASVLRQSAASYLASFLARAGFVDVSAVCARLQIMVTWLHHYLDNLDFSGKNISMFPNNDEFSGLTGGGNVVPNRHLNFHSVFQAVIYTVSFRFREILDMPQNTGTDRNSTGLALLENFSFERLVKCELNPLYYCLPGIVTNFSNIARNYQLAYCYSIIERNRRQQMYTSNLARQYSQENKRKQHQQQQQQHASADQVSRAKERHQSNSQAVEAFFPFDPYILRESQHFITPIYRQYTGLDSTESGMSDEDIESYGGSFGASPDVPMSLDSRPRSSSFRNTMMYAKSPGFKHS